MTRDLSRKLAKVARDPSLLRYRVLGRFGAFPVGRIRTPFFADLPVYCISLARATARRALIERQIASAGWQRSTLVDAVDASVLDVATLAASADYDSEGARLHHGTDLTLAQIACTLSHGRVWEQIVRARHERALVLEDDALLETRRLRRLDRAFVPSDCDVLFLNSFVQQRPPRGHVRGQVYGTESWHGSSAAYVITGAAAQRLASAYRPVQHAADGVLGRNMEGVSGTDQFFRQRGAVTSLRCYLAWPNPVANGSDVHFFATTLRPNT